MQMMKKVLCVAVCAVLLLSLAGCSTPKVAMTVDGKDYTTGEYLAYLFNNYSTLYNNQLYYYEYYGMDIWSQTFPYGEEDQEQLGLAEYLIKVTQDTIVRQKAVENMMAEYGITLSEEDEKELADQLASVHENDVIEYGFNKESYSSMYRAYNYNEPALFYGLYKEGGQRAVSGDEITAYIKENYLSYQIFSIALVDGNGTELEQEIKSAVTDFLKGYLAAYEQSKDLAAVFKDYVADIEKGVSLKDTAGKELATLSWDGTTVAVTLPSDKEEEESADTTDTADATEEEEEVEHTCDRQTGDKSTIDEDLAAAIEKIEEGKAAVTNYAADGVTATAALILRHAPLSGEDAVTVEDETENVLYYSKYEAFNEEVQKAADALEVTLNERAIEMCKPEYFDPNYEPGQTTTTTTTTTTVATTTTTTTTTTAATTTTTAAE